MRPYIAYEYTSPDWCDGVATASTSVMPIAARTDFSGSEPRVHPKATSRIHAESAMPTSAPRCAGVILSTASTRTEIDTVAVPNAAQTSAVLAGSDCANRCHERRAAESRTHSARTGRLGGPAIRTDLRSRAVPGCYADPLRAARRPPSRG